MGTLEVNDANFASEREVVKEEFRQNYVTPPYGRLNLLVEPRSFAVHPYRRPGIGSIEELDAARLDDVRAFHATYYRPDNATLIVVGDFDPARLDAWVDRYLGRVPKPDRPLPRVTVVEPPRARARRYTEYGPNVPLPAVVVTFLGPTRGSPDAWPLLVADAILSGGESSRMYRALVYEQQIAQEAYSYADLREQAGLFVLRATAAGGKKPDALERAMLAELRRMQQEPVSAAELRKAKNQILASRLGQRETNEGKAGALGAAAVLLGDPARVNTDIARLQAVTAADVRRAVRRYTAGPNAHPVVIHYLAESSRPAAPSTKPASPEKAKATR
jgi:zinc protease